VNERPPTPKMLQWLHSLEVQPGLNRRTRVGFLTMQRGWTEWNWVDRHGKPITLAEADERWGKPELWSHITSNGERITEAGLAILELHWPGRWEPRHDIEDDYAQRAEWKARR